jgi:hypothetical protein
MDFVMDELASVLGKPQSSLQAVLWFFEQQLFDAMGSPAKPEGLSDGAKNLLRQRGLDGSDTQATDLSGGTRRSLGQSEAEGGEGGLTRPRGLDLQGVRPSEQVVQVFDSFQDAQLAMRDRGGVKQGFRIHIIPSTKQAVLLQRPVSLGPGQLAGRPLLTQATDPEGREVAAQFVAGARQPAGTTRGLSFEDVQDVARQITRAVQIAKIFDSGVQGRFTPGPDGLPGILEVDPRTVDFEGTFRHEAGHAVEAVQHGLTSLLKAMTSTREVPADAVQALRATRRAGVEVDALRSGDPGANAVDIIFEMKKASSLMRPDLWVRADAQLEMLFPEHDPGEVRQYRNRFEELLADSVRFYMEFPEDFKQLAPKTARFIRDVVNPSKIGEVISFASIAGLATPAIFQAAMDAGPDDEEQT